MPPAGEVVELDVTALAAGGDAVGRDGNGRVTFVAGAAPGERIRARVVEAKKSFARAELIEVLVASPTRVAPPCPLASGACGGCPWMHVSHDAQLAAKHAIAAGALRRAIGLGLELPPPLAPVPPLRWRRRARYAWQAAPFRLGFLGRRSHEIADAPACVQLDERLDRAVATLRPALERRLTGRGELHALVGHDGAVHVVVEGEEVPRFTIGGATIELEPGVASAADDFAQASGPGNAALVAEVVQAVAPRPGLRVLELFAGAGNFTRHLVAAGADVVANDVIARDIPGARVEPGPAHRVVRAGFDVLLLDPPRTGAAELIAAVVALGAAAPPRIVYVSCDAATLARDLDRLCEAGYVPRRAQVLDLFPQTAHLEIVALLER